MKISGSITHLQKVPSTLVHKEFDDDVLIANMRDLLPSWIDSALLCHPTLSEDDKTLLRSAYDTKLPGALAGGSALGLSALPCLIADANVESVPAELLEVIHSNYIRIPVSGNWIISVKYMSEIHQMALMARFTERSRRISDEQRCHISRVLEKLPNVGRSNAVCFTMVMDTKNYFFYRKHHEHVPGIMLVEVIRQSMYAQQYRHGGHTRGEVSLTIDSMNVDFMSFVNSNYPLRLQVEDKRPPDVIARTAMTEPCATLWQLGRVVAVATWRVNPIKMNIFKRLRNIKPSTQARFVPTKNIASVATFGREDGTSVEGVINDISIDGLCASFDRSGAFEALVPLKCALFVETLGFINVDVETRWVALVEDRWRVGMRIVRIDAVSTLRLREAIKTFCFIKLSRGEL